MVEHELEVSINKNPQNMAALPSAFNKFPDQHSCPDIFHRIDVLRHFFTEAHDIYSRNFKTRRFNSQQAQEHFLGHRNFPLPNEYYSMQLGILKELNKVLFEIKKWFDFQMNKSDSLCLWGQRFLIIVWGILGFVHCMCLHKIKIL